jgi:hypothetical protein
MVIKGQMGPLRKGNRNPKLPELSKPISIGWKALVVEVFPNCRPT